MSDEMLLVLQGLLQQLELAQGGHDPEARARLDQLRQQLGVLDAAKQRATAAEAAGVADGTEEDIAAHLSGNASGSSGGAGLENGAAASPATSLAGGAATMLQQMDGLSARLAGLEYRLAHLDGDSRAVLVMVASGVEDAVTEVQDLMVVQEEVALEAENGGGGC